MAVFPGPGFRIGSAHRPHDRAGRQRMLAHGQHVARDFHAGNAAQILQCPFEDAHHVRPAQQVGHHQRLRRRALIAGDHGIVLRLQRHITPAALAAFPRRIAFRFRPGKHRVESRGYRCRNENVLLGPGDRNIGQPLG